MPIEIMEKELRGVIILALSGRLVLGQESSDFRAKVNAVLEENANYKEKWGWNPRLVLDLGDLSFVDSSGLGALIAARISAHSRGSEMKLANLTKSLRDVLAITKLATVFDLYDSADAAVNSYFPPPPAPAGT